MGDHDAGDRPGGRSDAWRAGIAGYAQEAPELLDRYEAHDPARLFQWLASWLPDPAAEVVDVGAGTGRDAAWLAQRGYRVVAVEPVRELREGARALHPEPGITWLDDHLPDLARLRAEGRRFDLIWLSAVWMHLDADERRAGMSSLAALARPGACLGLVVRHGPVPEGRRMFEIGDAETIALAAEHGFRCVVADHSPSVGRANQRAGVTWSRLGFRFGGP